MIHDNPLRIAVFTHSVVSDWNHGNAHFLRGLIRNLRRMGHHVISLEEQDNWSISNLVKDHGTIPVREFDKRFPFIDHQSYVLNGRVRLYEWLREVLDEVDACLVHEWNPPDLIRAIGRVAAQTGTVSLFHDTHHRALTEPERLPAMGLEAYTAILAYGPSIAEIYRQTFPGRKIVVFHEGADTDLFRPLQRPKKQDVLFIGNWGDEDRNDTTVEFFIDPARQLPGRSFALYGVRYPPDVVESLQGAGIRWGGWLPNYLAPDAYASSSMTVHIPRREYVDVLEGTPTIRVFEALACGTPLISAGWRDKSGMFEEGRDYLGVDSQRQMIEAVEWLATDSDARSRIGQGGMATVLARHTCAHRAVQLVQLIEELGHGASRHHS